MFQVLETRPAPTRSVSVVEQVRMAVEAMVDDGQGTMAIADALVTVAAQMAMAQAGRGGTARWLQLVALDVRSGRLQDR